MADYALYRATADRLISAYGIPCTVLRFDGELELRRAAGSIVFSSSSRTDDQGSSTTLLGRTGVLTAEVRDLQPGDSIVTGKQDYRVTEAVQVAPDGSQTICWKVRLT